MKKLICFALIALLLSSTAYASVGYRKDGVNEGNATTIEFERSNTTFDGSTVLVYGSGYSGGVTSNVSSESSLTSLELAYGFIRKVTADSPTTAKNTVGLANGEPGQMLTIQLVTKGTPSWVIGKLYGDTTTTTTGWTTLTFDTALDSITLLYLDDTTGWIVVGNNGVTVV